MNKTIEQLFQKKIDSFNKLSFSERSSYFNKYSFFGGYKRDYIIAINTVNKLQRYFLPFKVNIVTKYRSRCNIILYFNNKEYKLKTPK